MSTIKKINSQDLEAMVKQKLQNLIESESKNIGDPLDVKMNSQLKDEKISSSHLVSVEKGKEKTKSAGSKESEVKMNSNDGQDGKMGAKVMVSDKKEEVKTAAPASSTGEPFDKKVDPKMNEMDAEGDKTTKAFVEAGASDSEGQKAAKFSESPKNEKEKEEAIAKAIEIKEGQTFANKKELLEFCKREALKIVDLL